MSTNLKDLTVIITGGSKGYGYGIAKVFAEKGANVWITGRNAAVLLKASLELSVKHFAADICSGKDWDALFRAVMQDSGKVDILINNAGAGLRIAELSDMTDTEIEEIIAVNLLGASFGCSRASKIMKKQQFGSIINISSICQNQAWPSWSVYSAAKAGLAQLSKCLYTEMRPHGVKVSNIIPSWGKTDFNTVAGLDAFDEAMNSQLTQAEELGEFVANICELPQHLAVQEVSLLPLVQQIEPL